MFGKKLQTAVFSATISSLFLVVFDRLNITELRSFDEAINAFFLATPFVFIGTFLYGIPVSMIADKLAEKVSFNQKAVSYVLYILACILPSLFTDKEYSGIMLISLFVATFFFLIDQFIKNKDLSRSATGLFLFVLILWYASRFMVNI